MSASEVGDGCQVSFELDPDSESDYLIVQRHFEELDDGRAYIETDDDEFSGLYRLSRATLSRERFELWLGPTKRIEVTVSASAKELRKAARILEAIVPELQLEGEIA